MAEPFDTLAAAVADIITRLADDEITEAQAAAQLSPLLAGVNDGEFAARVEEIVGVIGRVTGLLFVEVPVGQDRPSNLIGAPDAYAWDRERKTFWGPKDKVTGWPEGDVMTEGPPGPSVELQKTATHVQWRVQGGAWANLILLSDLKGADGKEIELRSTATHIQWRVVGAASWIDLIPRADLKGDTGVTPDITIIATTGAAGSEVEVTKTGTAEAPEFAISIPRGNPGGTGATPILSVGTVETAPAGDPADANFTGTAEEPVLNLILPRGGPGNTGAAAWTPVFATEVDGERRVQRIVDWVGGGGAKPATGKYVGAAGLVDTAAEATDVRGAGGSGSGDMIGANNLSDLTDKAAARTTLSVHSKAEADGLYRKLLDLLNVADVDGLADALAAKATPADVTAAINALVGAAPGTLDTIYELAAWAQESGDALAALTTLVAGKASQADFNTLVATVGGKASQGALDALAATVGAISVPVKATGAELRTGADDAKFLTPKAVADAFGPVALVRADLASGVDFSTFINAGVVMDGNATLGAPTGLVAGRSGRIQVAQDATGGRTLAFNSAYKLPKNGLSIDPAANAVTAIAYEHGGAGQVRLYDPQVWSN